MNRLEKFCKDFEDVCPGFDALGLEIFEEHVDKLDGMEEVMNWERDPGIEQDDVCFNLNDHENQLTIFQALDVKGQLKQYLTGNGRYAVVSQRRKCGKVCFLMDRSCFAEIGGIKPLGRIEFVHSFGPSEGWLTLKDGLGCLIRLSGVDCSAWFKTAYRVNSDCLDSGSFRNEFPNFVEHFLDNQKNAQPNAWIIKPSDASRSQGITISDKMETLLDALEEFLVNKQVAVVCEYVTRPILFQSRKCDLRFMVAIRKSKPLEMFVYDHFLVRTSDEIYNPHDFSNVQSHLTVTKYRKAKIDPPSTEEFVTYLESHYGLNFYGKGGLMSKCFQVILELFQLATRNFLGEAGELVGLRQSNWVKAVYGIDIIFEHIDDDARPILLECNYKPDLERVLHDRPQFYNQLFQVWFDDSNVTHKDEMFREQVLTPTKEGKFYILNRI